MTEWVLGMIIAMAVLLGLIIWKNAGDDYEIIEVRGMPCVKTSSAISCDWSKYDD